MKQLKTLQALTAKLTAVDFVDYLKSEKAKDYFSDVQDDKTMNERVSDFDKLCLLVFTELSTALNEKNNAFRMILDCNYLKAKSKSDDVDLTVFSLLDKDDTRALHMYCKRDKTNVIKFSVCCSCDRHVLDKLFIFDSDSNSKDYKLTVDFINTELKIKFDKNNRAKTVYRDNVQYTQVVDLCKTICALLKD